MKFTKIQVATSVDQVELDSNFISFLKDLIKATFEDSDIEILVCYL